MNSKKVKVNFGCGKDIKKGYLNVDLFKFPGVDKKVNMDKFPYPFKDNSVDEVYCKSVLQIVKDPGGVISEFHRILKKGGRLYFDVPHFTSKHCWKDITHRRGFAFKSFDIFYDNNVYVSGLEREFRKVKIHLEFGKKYALWNYLIEPIANRFPSLYEDTPLRIFPAMRMRVYMIK